MDDISTAIIVDEVLLKFTTHKIHRHILESANQREIFVRKVFVILKKYIKDKDSQVAASNLYALTEDHLPIVKIKRVKFLRQITCYLNLINPDSGFGIQPCYRYDIYLITIF